MLCLLCPSFASLKQVASALLAVTLSLSGCASPPVGLAAEPALTASIRAEVGDAGCESDKQCKTLAMGEKDCGGPEFWLPWSTARSQGEKLQAWAGELVSLQRQRNEASGARSNCRFMPDPGASCQAKRCILQVPNSAN